MKPTLRLGVLLLAVTGSAAAAAPYRTQNERANAGPSAPAAQRSAQESSNTASKIEVFLARAEISVDAKGRPRKVTLLNPTDDAWVNRHAVQEIRRRSFSPPAGSARPAGETFTCTVRIEVRS